MGSGHIEIDRDRIATITASHEVGLGRGPIVDAVDEPHTRSAAPPAAEALIANPFVARVTEIGWTFIAYVRMPPPRSALIRIRMVGQYVPASLVASPQPAVLSSHRPLLHVWKGSVCPLSGTISDNPIDVKPFLRNLRRGMVAGAGIEPAKVGL